MTVRRRAYSYTRMSTMTQLAGDSLRRQDDPAKAFAESIGADLADDDQLKDIGISAFSGANANSGALSRFLEGIRAGKVPPGSLLLVEALDRLSRQEPPKALSLFLEIINGGVEIVTLSDNKTYGSFSDATALMRSVMELNTAHEESRIKSKRVRAAWANKRNHLSEKKLTKKCPGWLKLSEDRRSFEVLNDRARVVQRIFEESKAGIGDDKIARRLNLSGIQPFGRAKSWGKSSVSKILGSRAVLGEFQPHQLIGGKRTPDGEVREDYFPQIVSEELFYQAQGAKAQRRKGGAGRKGKGYSNLFSGLAKCAYCKSPMTFVNKGSSPKGGTYLVCEAKRRGLGCDTIPWRYDAFETSFLAFVTELDLSSLIHADKLTAQQASIAGELSTFRGQQSVLEAKRDQIFHLLDSVDLSKDYVAKKLEEVEAQIFELQSKILDRESIESELRLQSEYTYGSKEEIKKLLGELRASTEDEAYKLRCQIATRLKALVDTLLVAPAGRAPQRRESIEWLAKLDESGTQDVRNYLSADVNAARPYFLVGFKDGGVRAVFPNQLDPLEIYQQITSSQDRGIMREESGKQPEVVIPPKAVPAVTGDNKA